MDDHDPVRRSVCSLLSTDPTLDVVCESTNGEEAVTKAKELQPDLVLSDIGLPGISGLQAARQIRKVSAESRIIFLSQHNSLQMVREALKNGAHGYVTKSDAASELLGAIRAVLGGTYFVSQQIVEQGWVLETI